MKLLLLALLLVAHALISQPVLALVGVPVESDVHFQYDVVFSPHPLTAEAALQMPAQRLYPMRQSNGSSYVCVLPPSEEEVVAAAMDATAARKARGEVAPGLRPGQLVPLPDSNPIHDVIARRGCMEAQKGYWTYVLCVGRFVRQQHQEMVQGGLAKVAVTDVHYMGIYTREEARRRQSSSLDEASTELPPSWPTFYTYERDHEGPYLSSVYPMGEECALTGEPRETEVHLRCRREGGFMKLTTMEVEEVHTCGYTVSIYDRELCSFALLKPTTMDFSIVCHPIAEDDPQPL